MTNKTNSQSNKIPTSVKELLILFKQKTLGGEIVRGSAGVFILHIVDLLLKFGLGVVLARVLGPS
ncbi:hypothetical protein, partial [Natronospira sp.]|uniref:hypothetical protein n=1 Tax=Natronospira sp. TaxID=2024970 RepID=UPI003872C132